MYTIASRGPRQYPRQVELDYPDADKFPLYMASDRNLFVTARCLPAVCVPVQADVGQDWVATWL